MRFWLAAAAGSLCVALVVVGSQVRVSADQAGTAPQAQAVFTAEQASAGKAVYGRTCAPCHMPDLGGTADAPSLSGNRFADSWRSRTTKQLFEFVVGAMPPGGAAVTGDMKPETYAQILAYVLQSNGASPGDTLLGPSTDVPLERIVRARSTR
jgi:mono/diheme cytochrome c family protein